MPKKKSELAIARKGKVGKISVVGDIGWDFFGVSYASFKKQLTDLGKVDIIEVEINSPGGVVTDGIAMFNALREHKATIHTYISGQAASMGSVLAMAGDRVFMPDNSLMFIHKPLNMMIGNAEDMRKMAEDLDKFEDVIVKSYQSRFRGTEEEIREIMAADSWLTADEVAEKFVDVTVIASGEQEAAAHSEPVEILGDVGMPQESFIDRATNKLRNKVQNNQQEVEMTPEERKELEEGIVAKVTASVLAALEGAGEEEEVEEVEAEAETPDIDMDDPEAVSAYLASLEKQKAKDAVDWSDPKSVKAYCDSLKPEEAPQAPTTNSTPSPEKNGEGEDTKFTPEAMKAAAERMVKSIK